MVKNIIIVGCGNIGSRHIQALANLPFETNITVVDPSIESQKIAQIRLKEIDYDYENHEFQWHMSINELEQKNYDLAIVATTAVNRLPILEKLLELGNSKLLIEKMVCQSVKEYEKLLDMLKKFKAEGWVNTNLRYFPSWQKIKEQINSSKSVHFSVVAPNISALGTNAIHYLDLFSWLINNYEVNLHGEFLINELFPNKRGSDLVEFAGTLIGTSSRNSFVSLTFLPDVKIPITINIINGDKHLLINETNQKITDLVNTDIHEFKYEHVSSTTKDIVVDIITKNNCQLTTIRNSFYLHKEIINTFNSHIEKVTNRKIECCPIT